MRVLNNLDEINDYMTKSRKKDILIKQTLIILSMIAGFAVGYFVTYNLVVMLLSR